METIPSLNKAHILLIGMMGAGKTTIGEVLAESLGRSYIDSDEQVVQATGKSVAEIFRDQGEAAFRLQERLALENAVGSFPPAVISIAGGAVLNEDNRRLISNAGKVIFLRASLDTLTTRLGDGEGRPLLSTGSQPESEPGNSLPGNQHPGESVRDILSRLLDQRMPLYTEIADVTVDVDDLSIEEQVAEIRNSLVQKLDVSLADRSYQVYIGPTASEHIKDLLPKSASKVAIVTSKIIIDKIKFDFSQIGLDYKVIYIEEGEKSKSLANIEYLCSAFADFNLTRQDVVMAVGGGVITDLAGFAAASYHRGTPLINVATTLLAQIDAAIGGKTGVNIKQGKNLVGAFWQPLGVICDSDHLLTLPEPEWYSGLGEMVKYGFLGVENLDNSSLFEQIYNCAQLKARIVSGDERESNKRMLLNYGHTMAHALEGAGFAETDEDLAKVDGSKRSLRHGEAVAIGIVFAALLAHKLARIDAVRVKRHIELVRHYGLPVSLPVGVQADNLIWFMKRDKKATLGLTFVLDGPNGVEVVNKVEEEKVKETIEYMGIGDFLDTFS